MAKMEHRVRLPADHKVVSQKSTATVPCSKCGKSGHIPRECRVVWHRAWPGRYVTKLGIRYPDGSRAELTVPLPVDLGERLQSILLEAIR